MLIWNATILGKTNGKLKQLQEFQNTWWSKCNFEVVRYWWYSFGTSWNNFRFFFWHFRIEQCGSSASKVHRFPSRHFINCSQTMLVNQTCSMLWMFHTHVILCLLWIKLDMHVQGLTIEKDAPTCLLAIWLRLFTTLGCNNLIKKWKDVFYAQCCWWLY